MNLNISTHKSKRQRIKESPLFWPAQLKGAVLYVLDETKIPQKVHYVKVKNTKEAVNVIRQMKTRAFGQFLVVLNTFLLEINRRSGCTTSKSDRTTSIGAQNRCPTFFSERYTKMNPDKF